MLGVGSNMETIAGEMGNLQTKEGKPLYKASSGTTIEKIDKYLQEKGYATEFYENMISEEDFSGLLRRAEEIGQPVVAAVKRSYNPKSISGHIIALVGETEDEHGNKMAAFYDPYPQYNDSTAARMKEQGFVKWGDLWFAPTKVLFENFAAEGYSYVVYNENQ